MNRGITACLLFSALAASFLGCGGRTDTEFAEAGAGGSSGVSGDTHGASGAPLTGTSGSPTVAGSPSIAGSPSFAGTPGFAGNPGFAGGPSAGGAASSGAPGFGGFPNHGGSPGFGGSLGVAGTPTFGGSSGDAGAGGFGGVIVDACVSLAQNQCDQCLCQVCSDSVVGCFSDPGCAQIFACIEKTGCQGFGCYTNATCRQVIKQNGGLTGAAAGEVFALVSCATSSQGVCACN